MPGKADICLKQSKLEYGEYAKGVMRNHSVFFFCTKMKSLQENRGKMCGRIFEKLKIERKKGAIKKSEKLKSGNGALQEGSN